MTDRMEGSEIGTEFLASKIRDISDDWDVLEPENKHLSGLVWLASRLVSPGPLSCGSPPS